jgi:hypothetical protein
MGMAPITINEVVPGDASPDPMARPTTSFLARTTSYTEILAGYVAIVSRLSISRHPALRACRRG